MKKDDFEKVVAGVDKALRDNTRSVAPAEVEAAMDARAEDSRRDDETSEAAYSRMLSTDPVMKFLNHGLRVVKNLDVDPPERDLELRDHLFERSEQTLDDYVETQKRVDESTAQTYARLSRTKDHRFGELYAHLAAARGIY